MRFGARSDAMLAAFDPEDSDRKQDDNAENVVLKRKGRSNHVKTAQDLTRQPVLRSRAQTAEKDHIETKLCLLKN